jgi:hypothetical protein
VNAVFYGRRSGETKMRLSWLPFLGVFVNCGLWALALAVSLPLADDPMFISAHRADGTMAFRVKEDVLACADCAAYALLGREVGGAAPSSLLILFNMPAVALAAGQDLGLGIRELSAQVLFIGIVVQWAIIASLWTAWRLMRERHATTASAP